MSTSDTRNERIRSKKNTVRPIIRTYLGVTLVCGLVSLIYESFSFGVYSNYMIFLFLIPLMGGVLPFATIRRIDCLNLPRRIPMNLYHAGIATLIVGSCLQGILEIYGTTSVYIPVYWIVGALLTVFGSIGYFIGLSARLSLR